MSRITYTALRKMQKTGFRVQATDLSASGIDDSFNALSTSLSGMLLNEWLKVEGFTNAANNGWFQVKSNSTAAKIIETTAPITHLRLPGTSGNSASTPDSAAISITGDIDIIVQAALPDWTQTSVTSCFISKDDGATNISYRFQINASTSRLRFIWSADGSSATIKDCTAAISVTDGLTLFIRVTLDVDNGAAGNDVKFWTSTDYDRVAGTGTWTQLGSTVTTAGVTSVFNGNAPLYVGAFDGSSNMLQGRVYYAEIRNGIDGTIAAALDPSLAERGDTSITAATGEVWTINQSGTPPAELQGSALVDEGAEYLNLPGVVGGNYASTPDSAAISITGDLDVRIKVAMDDWTPSSDGSPIGKWHTTGNNRSWELVIGSEGKLWLYWSADGTTVLNAVSSVVTGIADGSVKWIRATLDVNNGAAGRDVKFYTSTDYDPITGTGTWTQLGTTQTSAGVTSIFDSTAALTVGAVVAGSANLIAGKVYYAELRSGIAGPVVACFDPGRVPAGSTSLVAYTGETWTINQSGGSPAALVRLNPITLTGYTRGYAQSYDFDFNASRISRPLRATSNSNTPRGGGRAEVLLHRIDELIEITPTISTDTEAKQWREILASLMAGELFTLDPYGTAAVPVEELSCQLESVEVPDEVRPGLLHEGFSFTARVLG